MIRTFYPAVAALLTTVGHASAADDPRAPHGEAVATDGPSVFSGAEVGFFHVGGLRFAAAPARIGRYGQTATVVTVLDLHLRFWRFFNVMGDIGSAEIDDLDPFTNLTICTGVGCEPDSGGEKKSDVVAATFSAAAGLALPPIALGPIGVSAAGHIGSFFIDPKRRIPSCDDCDREDWPALQGYFVEPSASIGHFWAFADKSGALFTSARGAYRHFLSDSDLIRSWSVGVSFGIFLPGTWISLTNDN